MINRYALPYKAIEIDLNNPLGEGSFGTCYKGVYQEQSVAIKTMRVEKVTKREMSKFKAEVLASDQPTNNVSLKVMARFPTRIQSTKR